jgi:hypothetical protein
MRLLLTSGGVTNATIRGALVEMLGKPIDTCHALCIPTAQPGSTELVLGCDLAAGELMDGRWSSR